MWIGPDGKEVDTTCLITTEAKRASAAIHPRLRVLIEPDPLATWLDPDEGRVDTALAPLRPPNNAEPRFVLVGEAVNRVGNDDPTVPPPTEPRRTSAACDGVQASLFQATLSA